MTETTTPLTPEREQEIQARAEAATPGPWCTDSWEIYQGTEYEPGLSSWIGETCRADDSDGARADAAFIAHARQDVPALLSEIAALRRSVAHHQARADKLSRQVVSVRRERHAAEHSSERFRAAWESARRRAAGEREAAEWIRDERDLSETEVDRLRAQRRFLIGQIQQKDAQSGAGDAALREFLGTADAAVVEENR